MNQTAYPLCWPAGKPRSVRRHEAQFSTSLADARDALMLELQRMGARSIILSTNLELRRDGLPRAVRTQPADTGAAVYFNWREQSYCFACDWWRKVEDNVQAIRKTIEALRGIARWGTGDMMAAAFAGFLAIGAGSSWWQVLGVDERASPDEINAAYRAKAKSAHPDMPGGSHERMQELNAARQQGLDSNPF